MRRYHCALVTSAVFCTIVLLGSPPADAGLFVWTGQGDTENWYSRHFTGQYDSEHRAIYVNNWGQVSVDPSTPGAGDDATIGGAYNARIDWTNNPAILNLNVGAPAALYVANGGSLTVHGPSVFNAGQIHIAYGGMAGGGILQVDNATVSGGGTIVFESAGTLSGALTLEAGNLIRGSGGHLSAAMLNRGSVNADVNNSWLRLEANAKTNEGTFSASNGGRLEVSTSITQSLAGLITAGDNSTVQYLTGSSVTGGTTAASGTGKHLISGQNVTTTLTDITSTGKWLAENGSFVHLSGSTFTNNGTFEVGGYTGGAGMATLRVDAEVTLTGAGDLLMNPGIVDSPGGHTLTNSAAHTIHGRGNFKAGLDNHGVISADQTSLALILEGAAKSNAGTMKATNGAYLDIKTTISQTAGGQIIAENGSSVRYSSGSAVTGGTTTSDGTGKHLISGQNVTTTLTDITNTGKWLAENGSFVHLGGSTFTNNGTFEAGGYTGGAGWATLMATTNVLLAGNGQILLKPGIVDSAAGATLTNSASHTIHGQGYLRAALDNQGQVIADTNSLSLEWAAKSNAGTMKATNGASLDIKTTIAQAAAGQIIAENGSSVRYFGGSAVAGGTTTSDGTGRHTISGQNVTTTLTDLTNSGTWLAENGSFVNLGGATFTNNGTVEAGGYTGGAGWATVQPGDGLVLQGSGTLLLNPGKINSPAAVSFTNAVGHTIRGVNGRIYGNVTLSNLGTLEANGGTLTVDTTPPQFAGTSLTAGTWKAINGTLSIGGSPSILTNQASVLLSGPASTFAPINPLADNQGEFSVLGGRTFTTTGSLANSGLLTVGSASTVSVNGGYTQTSGRTVVDGDLIATGPLAFTGGELAGTGTLRGAARVGSGAVLTPGHSAGVLTFEQLALDSGAVFKCEIDGPDADRIEITGSGNAFTLASGGTFTINLSLLDALGVLNEYTLFRWTGDDPVFAGTTWMVTGLPGLSGTVSFLPDLNSIVLTDVIVPDPASVSLLCLGATALIARRRRR